MNVPALSRALDLRGMLAAAWRYREFVLSSIRNEYRARFARSKLGGLWMIVHPLVNAAIFAVVLAELVRARLPDVGSDTTAYALYVSAGMLAWSMFAEIVTRCLTVFIDNGSTLRKLYFPRICLPLIVAGTALLNNVLMFAAVLLVFAVLGRVPAIGALWVPVLMVVPLVLGLGVGLFLGMLNVFVRDIGQVIPVVLQVAFWFSPVLYLPQLLPAFVRPLLHVNPMTPVIQAYQQVMLDRGAPDWVALAYVFAGGAALLAATLFLFRRASAELVDAL
jgi:lipopolysaccharide transport system permease protein